MDITVALLIYKSPAYLDFVMESLLDNHSEEHNVQYLIVCNDATQEVIDRADYWSMHEYVKIHHVVHVNEPKDSFWIQNVYSAWNRCLDECKTPYICFVNSDMAFSKNWINNLAKYDTTQYIPTSRLIESGRMPSLPGLISRNFGQTLRLFDREGFEAFASQEKRQGMMEWMGAYMPSLFKVETLRAVGGWSKNMGNTPGDQITFKKLYQKFGLKHIMVLDSIAYHFQEGERTEVGDRPS